MNLPKKNNLVLDHRYFLGSFRDYSNNNNSGTPTGCAFQKKPDKHVIFEGTDLITVADSPELRLTEGTIIFYGDLDTVDGTSFVSKRDAGGTNYDIFGTTTPGINFYDGNNVRTASFDFAGAKSMAVSFVSGSKAKAYQDGAYIKDFADTSTITVNDAPLYIGNRYDGGNPQKNPLKGVLIYNTVLTDEEIAQAHAWIMATKTPSYPKKNFVYPSQIPDGHQISYGDQILVDGNMEAVGTAAWSAGNLAILSKDATDPYAGTQALKIAYNGTANPYAAQTNVIGQEYRVTGWAKGDGTNFPRMLDGNGSTLLSLPGVTAWTRVDFTYTAAQNHLRWYGWGTTGYSEYDDLLIQPVRETIAAYDMKNVHGKIIDKTGNGNDLTIVGASQSKGLGGLSVLDFNGSSYTEVAVTAFGALRTRDFALVALVKTSTAQANQSIISYGNWGGTTIVQATLNMDTPGVALFKVGPDNASFGNIEDGEWHLLVGARIGNNIYAYLDGHLVNTTNVGSITDLTYNNLLFVGARFTAIGMFEGSIGESQIIIDTVDQAKVSAMYNKYAKMPYFLDSLKDANESIAAES